MADIEGLHARIMIARFVLSVLEKEIDDPRQPEALRHYRAQLEELEKQYAEATKPPSIVIGLKTARLSTKV